MEKRMDCHNQPPEENQISLSEEKPSSSSALPQDQRLFKSIMWLTLFLGIMIGIGLALFGASWYLLAGYIPHAFYPTSPIIYRLLAPLLMVSVGIIEIIQAKLLELRQQHPVFQPGRFDILGKFPASLSYGLWFIWIGGGGVFIQLFDPNSFLGKTVLLIWGIGGLSILVALWLIPFLKRRRMA